MEPTKYIGFAKVFPEKLKFWFWHCLINALPSYLIAVVWLELWKYPVAHVAIGCAVLTFMLGYSVVTSLPGPLTRKETLYARALKAALVIRIVISAITVMIVPTGVFLLLTPDLWCGRFAATLVSKIYGFLGFEATLLPRANGGGPSELFSTPGFMEIYLTTVLEGLILSFMLFIFSFIAIIILQMRDRKRMFREGRI